MVSDREASTKGLSRSLASSWPQSEQDMNLQCRLKPSHFQREELVSNKSEDTNLMSRSILKKVLVSRYLVARLIVGIGQDSKSETTGFVKQELMFMGHIQAV